MFKLTNDENIVRTLSQPVSVDGHETVPANMTIPKGHRLWKTYQAWLDAGNTPEPFDTRDLAQVKDDQINKVNADTENFIQEIRSSYPESEVLSWDKQEREARLWVEDNTTSVPLLEGIASARGTTVDVLAPKVIEKADQYNTAIANAIGKRQALEDQIDAATTKTEVESIVWS